jgi:AraC family transcriptional regulator
MVFSSTSAPLPAAAKPNDSLGCHSEKLRKNQQLAVGDLTLYRKATDDSRFGCVETPASGRGFLVGVSMATGHRRRILRNAAADSCEFEQGSIYTRDFTQDYRADLHGSFDFLLFEVSRPFLERVSDDGSGRRVSGLAHKAGHKDPVLFHLAQALAPSLERPGDASMLFVEQMSVVIGTHLVQQYGGALEIRPRALSRVHEARAKEMLLAGIDGAEATLVDIAGACQLSRSHFIQAFRETTGQTPHQWLMQQRLERARGLLRASTLSLAEIALAAGFSDQSHFTRFFTRAVGVAPGQWRRTALC